MLIEEITLRNILSFGPDTKPLKMEPLNVLIGPNGSGKSNFIDALSILQAAPRDIDAPFRDDGLQDWLWNAPKSDDDVWELVADIKTLVRVPVSGKVICHRLGIGLGSLYAEIRHESIDGLRSAPGQLERLTYYRLKSDGKADIYIERDDEGLRETVNIRQDQSILSQRKDPDQYPEVTRLAEAYESIRIYGAWESGRGSAVHKPQKVHRRDSFLDEDMLNLAHVLRELKGRPDNPISDWIEEVCEGVTDYSTRENSVGELELDLREGDNWVPVSRLSDGTLRYLCLLTVLCHPTRRH